MIFKNLKEAHNYYKYAGEVLNDNNNDNNNDDNNNDENNDENNDNNNYYQEMLIVI